MTQFEQAGCFLCTRIDEMKDFHRGMQKICVVCGVVCMIQYYI